MAQRKALHPELVEGRTLLIPISRFPSMAARMLALESISCPIPKT
jgi:hypothetical protein